MGEFKLKLPVTDNGVIDPKPAQTLTPEQIEAKRLEAEKAIADAETERLRLEAEEGSKTTPPANKDVIDDTKIIINDVEYTVNETGDAIDAEGKIIMTKADIDKLAVADEGNEIDPFDVIHEVLEFKPEVDGKPVVYEKTQAGLEQLLLDSATAKAEKISEDILNNFWNQNPQLKQLRDHYTLTGKVDTYRPEPVWKAVDIETLNDEQLEQVILNERMTKGDTAELAKYFVDGLKRDNKLKEFAIPAIKYLSDVQEAKAFQAEKRINDAKLERQTALDNYWKSVDKALTTKKLKIKDEEFVIPTSLRVKETDGKIVIKTINDFNDYIRKEKLFTIDGHQVRMTEYSYDLEMESRESNVDTDIFKALRKFLKNDDSQLVAAKAKYEEVKKVRKLITRDSAKSTPSTGKALTLKLPVK